MQLLSSSQPDQTRATEAEQPSEGRLTPREKDVLRLLAKGKRNQEIAEDLGLSVRSIGNHLAKIYNKLHIHRRSEAVLYAIRTGLAAVE